MKLMISRAALAALSLLSCLSARSAWCADAELGADFFERKIRPLFVQHCYSCHGKGQKKGGLSLDNRDAMMTGGDRGPAFESDAPDKSLLLEAVQYSSDLQMPPGGKLADHEIALLKQWTSAGAPWPKTAESGSGIRTSSEISAADRQFWSFRPFTVQPLPTVRDAAWPSTRIDSFLLQRLDSESLAPSPAADKRTWLRRTAFTLTGLPPHADHLAEFLADEGPDAWERAADRLLASPHLGERWSRHWLDIARYGEDQAHTFQARVYPNGFRFRDWVIQSFNQDLPYNDFVAQQIAGDLLVENPNDERKVVQAPALGFFALGPVYYADAGCAPKAQADEWDDRIDTLARGLLGLTLACARCHDHKFDPLTMQDYYALAGVFASTKYEEIPLVPRDVVQAYDAAVARAKSDEDKLNAAQNAASRQVAEAHADQTSKYIVAAWTLTNRRKVDGKASAAKVAEEFGLQEVFVESWRKHLSAENRNQRGHLAAYDQKVAGEDAKTDVSQQAEARAALETVANEIQQPIVAALMEQTQRQAAYRAAVDAAADDQKAKVAKPKPLEKPQADLLQAVLYDGKAPFAAPKDKLSTLVSADEQAKLKQLAEQAAQSKQAVGPKYPVAHGLADAEPKTLKIHLRGNHKTLGDDAPRRFLAVLSPEQPASFSSGSGRLELARSIASPTNPLTARVMVNRVWQQHFGRGIVDTPSNFGTLGAPPTHPELLDDLAARFVSAGWSLKQLHREIVTSAAFRQSSAHSPDGEQRDPENRLLWRAPRQRLDVEGWRDAMLLVTGQLNLAVGGPSQNLNDANHRRRTLYSSVSRHDLNAMLRLFDFPDPNLTSERRSLTTVPMQQLFMLNSDFMVRQARALAARLNAQPDADDTAKVLMAYELVFQREPSSEEREFCVEFVRKAGEDRQAKLSPWEQFAQALLAANEFMFVD